MGGRRRVRLRREGKEEVDVGAVGILQPLPRSLDQTRYRGVVVACHKEKVVKKINLVCKKTIIIEWELENFFVTSQ